MSDEGGIYGYVCDEELKRASHREQRNHWEVYLREIDNQMGLCGRAFALEELDEEARLSGLQVMVVGAQSGTRLSDRARANLKQWVQAGGVLIGFAARGLDEVFGIEHLSTLAQGADDSAIAAYFEFRLHRLTLEVHPFLHIEQKLFALSDVELVELNGAVELAHLYDREEQDLNRPAITWHSLGKGFAGYFAFDLPKTVWLLHQGRPLPAVPEGEKALRTPQLQVLGRNSTKIAYADEMVHLLQNLLSEVPLPFIHPIPPEDGRLPEALLYYSGDEYTGPVELSLKASDFMASRGLGYHINIAAERHPMTKGEMEQIRANGHEVSCYLWIRTDSDGSILNQRTLQAQSDRLYERFGFRPGSVLIGSTQWAGWAEPARWLAQAGATADNTFVGSKLFDHPLLNGPFFGFGFGTSYPFFFYEDYRRANERIDLVEQPIVCYEVGHRASLVDEHTQEREWETRAPEEVHAPIDRALRYHLVMNLFYHPWYIAHCPYCRDAIDEILSYIEARGAHVLHWGNNRVADWWHTRARASAAGLAAEEGVVRFRTQCDWSEGMAVKVKLNRREVISATNDGDPVRFEVKQEFGGTWVYVLVPAGTHQIVLRHRTSAGG